MKDRVELLIQTLEADLHIEFPASRREAAKDAIRKWLHQYDVPKPELQAEPHNSGLDVYLAMGTLPPVGAECVSPNFKIEVPGD